MRDLLRTINIAIVGITGLLVTARLSGQQIRLPETKSPDGNYVIIAQGSVDAPKAVYFANTATGRALGWIIRPGDAGMSNLRVQAKWNRSSSKVALIVSYGTKISNLEIFGRHPDGRFLRVEFTQPDPVTILRQRKPDSVPESAQPTASDDCLGFWKSENMIRLLTGTEVVVPQKENSILTLYVSFKVTVDGERASVDDIDAFGPFDDVDADSFRRSWNMRGNQ